MLLRSLDEYSDLTDLPPNMVDNLQVKMDEILSLLRKPPNLARGELGETEALFSQLPLGKEQFGNVNEKIVKCPHLRQKMVSSYKSKCKIWFLY